MGRRHASVARPTAGQQWLTASSGYPLARLLRISRRDRVGHIDRSGCAPTRGLENLSTGPCTRMGRHRCPPERMTSAFATTPWAIRRISSCRSGAVDRLPRREVVLWHGAAVRDVEPQESKTSNVGVGPEQSEAPVPVNVVVPTNERTGDEVWPSASTARNGSLGGLRVCQK
jgi:hypothetical protein